MTSGVQQGEEGRKRSWNLSCPYSVKSISKTAQLKKAKLLASLCGMCAKLHVLTLYHNARTTCLGHAAVAVLQVI